VGNMGGFGVEWEEMENWLSQLASQIDLVSSKCTSLLHSNTFISEQVP